jgi:hypothetical protein
MSEFPYGNDLNRPDNWVGHMPTKSKTWLVSYDGSFSVVCGYHSFIFLGLESLNIAVVNLLNCGISASLPIGKLFKGRGKGAETAERALEDAGRAKDGVDAIEMEQGQRAATSGMALYRRMTKGIPQMMHARRAFSLQELAGMAGGIVGAEIELGAAAAAYMIEGTDGPFGKIIFRQGVANAGDGLVSAGVGISAGFWEVETWHNLYIELGTGARARCAIANQSPSYDQPYRQIPNLHPYLASLPPVGCSFAETGFNPQRAFQ